MVNWPLRVACAVALASSGARQMSYILQASDASMIAFWFFGSLVTFLVAVIVLVQGVR